MTHAWITSLYESQLAEFDRSDSRAAAAAREAGGLRLFATIGSECYLRADASVWCWRAVNWAEPGETTWAWEEAFGVDRLSALVLGGEKYPDVRRLLPARSAAAVECSTCHGIGYLLRTPTQRGVVCPTCGGLCWTSEETAAT